MLKTIFTKIKIIVESNDTLGGKIFDIFIQILIFLSLLTFSIGTLPNLPKPFIKILDLFEYITIVVFTLEYLLRIIVCKNKFTYIFSFYGLIDLSVILPFWIGTRIDLRFVRIFRLFRIFRIFKLIRFSKAIQRLATAFKLIYQELLVFLIATLFIVFIASAGIYFFENPVQPDKFASIFHCAWWAVATLTTVGYGDVYPITAGGRIFTFIVLVVGIGVVAVPTGLIASALTKEDVKGKDQEELVLEENKTC